jgi:glutamate dehydrogenase
MATMNSPRNAQLLEEVLNQVERRVATAERDQLIPFVEAYFTAFPADELSQRDIVDVYGATYSLWRFIQQRQENEAKVSIFNPDVEQHGWQSQRTVVAALVPDMPFIVDSMRLELNRRGIAIHNIHNAVLTLSRCDDGSLQGVQVGDKPLQRAKDAHVGPEALVFMEIARQSGDENFAAMEKTFKDVLSEVRLVVNDYHPMRKKALEVAKACTGCSSVSQEEAREASEFLSWLANNHFTFLGYKAYRLPASGKMPTEAARDKQDLGIFKQRSDALTQDVVQEIATTDNSSSLLRFSKSAVRSRVHRFAYPDYVTVRVPAGDGKGTMEYRFLGMYTSSVYQTNPRHMPVLRHKVHDVEQRSGLDMDSHDGKELRQILGNFPRDELVLSNNDQLLETIMGVWQIQERRQVRLFVRQSDCGKFISALVYTPRDIYRTEVRAKIEAILGEAFCAEDVDFTTFFSESILTRTHFVFRVQPGCDPEFNVRELEQRVNRAAQQWSDLLDAALIEELGEEKGCQLSRRYANSFPVGYCDTVEPRAAIGDIRKIEQLSEDNGIQMKVYRVIEEGDHMLHFRLYNSGKPLALSDLLPPLENMGLRVEGDNTYSLKRHDGLSVYIHDFSLSYGLTSSIRLDAVREKFQQAFLRVWQGDAENDTFNKLLLGTRLDWREIALLRAYARYMKQIGFKLREEFIAETLGRYLGITNRIVDLFKARFQPGSQDAEKFEKISARIDEALNDVDNLNEDKIVRQYVALIKATLRTNFYQKDASGQLKGYFSFKLSPAEIPDVPLPVPMFEIFVYSPHVEGVHLRGGRVARGGLRWSDRVEDFRTEVLGLVKAQQVKNAVIVPVGAKGGFVAKSIAKNATRAEFQAGGVAAYKTFISGLLDVTDNIVQGEIVPPKNVVRHDEDDAYLVVAADKGTATFSDIANEISQDYGFWMGDAFASGGSIGYDHKKMGITARGAWVSVQRHFRERGLNVQTDEFSVVGIGDMAGDVFGNGMLQSEHILLKAAFNHLHIFIDPTPEAKASYEERKRLFYGDSAGWDAYNKELISKGGGLFLRSAKSIPISNEMKKAFAIEANSLTPNELINALLKAPIDLMWNGGIGTYIKASSETHMDVGDKANDSLRVDGRDVQFKVIGEGGNLGLTQLGRVEFALNGGACNTDFIDNAAGVDCSDHEVNIKILLHEVVSNGDMTEKQRRKLLESMTDEVADLVLSNNYAQTQAISIAESEAHFRHGEYTALINNLESSGKLNRALEFIPSDEVLTERKAQGGNLTRPELSVLISYVKGQLKEELACDEICNNDYMARYAATAFPANLNQDFAEQINNHRLHKEIIATQVANAMVNHMGIAFVDRMIQQPGTSTAEIALAYVTASEVFSLPKYWRMIEELDYKVDAKLQLRLMTDLIRLTRRACHWFLRHRCGDLSPTRDIEDFKSGVDAIAGQLDTLLNGHLQEVLHERRERFSDEHIPEELLQFIAGTPSLYAALSIVEAAHKVELNAPQVARIYFTLGEALDLHWFNMQISDLPVETQWQALAREAYRDDLEWQQGAITESVLQNCSKEEELEQAIESWMQTHGDAVYRWHHLITEIRAVKSTDFAVYTVASRALMDLARQSAA